MRLFLAAFVVGITALAVPAQGGSQQTGPLPSICLPVLLPCPPQGAPPPPPGTEPQPNAATGTAVRHDPRRIVVRFRLGTRRATINAAFARAGVVPERALLKIRFHLVRAEEARRDQALGSLRREASVESVERETLVETADTTPNDPAWQEQRGLRLTHFPRAWDVTQGSSRTVVAVLDTGVDGSHPDLRGALVPGYDFFNRDAEADDDEGHGTAVAGILAARGNNATGVAGACWTCSIMPVKVLGHDGIGVTSAIAAGIIWAVDHDADVINLSLGGAGSTDALSEAVRYAIRKDVVVVAAAGNSGSTTPFYPAAESSVLSVAATDESDRLYSWSNRGTWVGVAAPGCNPAPWEDGTYVSFCGTSSAAPVVAGLAALIRAARPAATATDIVTAVEKAVVQIPAEVRHGRIDAAQALTTPAPLPSPSPHAAGASRRSVSYRGLLTPKVRSRTYKLPIGPGRIVAHLRIQGQRRLSLWLAAPGRPVTRAAGAGPLRLIGITRTATTVRLLVAGRPKRASYRLTISYVAP